MKKYDFNHAQDWVEYFRKIFDVYHIKKILEFGLGLGTEFLCDECDYVTSIELSCGNYNKEWTETTKNKLKGYENWNLKYVDLPEELKSANQAAIELRYPLQDTMYLHTLYDLLSSYSVDEYDMVFVDPGIHNRGDIINFLFGKVPIIAAHDTSKSGIILENIYGYNIVVVPSDYEEIHFDSNLGTTFWIRKNHEQFNKILNHLKK